MGLGPCNGRLNWGSAVCGSFGHGWSLCCCCVVVVVVGARFRQGLPIVWAKIPQSTLFRARKCVLCVTVFYVGCAVGMPPIMSSTLHGIKVWAVNKDRVYRF
jgi:hypothetical protein